MVEELISLYSMHVGFIPSVYCSTATTVRVHSFQLDQNAHKKFPRDLKTVLNNTHLCTSVHNNTLSVAHLQIQTFSHSLEQKTKTKNGYCEMCDGTYCNNTNLETSTAAKRYSKL